MDEFCYQCGKWVADGEMYYSGVTPLCEDCHGDLPDPDEQAAEREAEAAWSGDR